MEDFGSETGTVLVVGAGASSDYGFPTGEKLLGKLIEALEPRSQTAEVIIQAASGLSAARRRVGNPAGWQNDGMNIWVAAEALFDVLQKNRPPSIDRLLADQRAELVDVGKAAIASVLLEEEANACLSPDFDKDWVRELWRWGLDAKKSSRPLLHVVTLNYDRSFERILKTAADSHFRHAPAEVERFDYRSRIPVHAVHGSLGSLTSVKFGSDDDSVERRYDGVMAAAQELSLLHEVDSYEQAAQLMLNAEAVCFLGFGYHDAVLDRLFPEHLWPERRNLSGALRIYGTSFDRTEFENERVESFFRERLVGSASKVEWLPDRSRLALRTFPVLGGARKTLSIRDAIDLMKTS